MKHPFKLTQANRKAIVDMLLTPGLIMEGNKYKGKEWNHSAETVEDLIKNGYAEINTRSGEGRILSVMPTEKAVYLIPASA